MDIFNDRFKEAMGKSKYLFFKKPSRKKEHIIILILQRHIYGKLV